MRGSLCYHDDSAGSLSAQNKRISHLELLRGRVKIPTGGIARELRPCGADPVRVRSRQYSLDERRVLEYAGRMASVFPPLMSELLQGRAY